MPKLIGADTLNRPRNSAPPDAAASVALTICASAGRRLSARVSAASVGVMRPAWRVKSAEPSAASKSLIRLLITDFETSARIAAPEMEPASMTARKVSISLIEQRILSDYGMDRSGAICEIGVGRARPHPIGTKTPVFSKAERQKH